ncbi:MAG: hypothetical protein E6Q97_20230 [Desulfurellales bacterium]|nr:MAG: hypothetical protein E6Q97_20230 [Desulfurellales bacterium]
MTIRKVSVSVGLTVNAGNYSSGRIEMTAEADLDPGEDDAAAHQALTQALKQRVRVEATDAARIARDVARGQG